MAVQGGRVPGQELPDEHTDVEQNGVALALEEAYTPTTDSQWLALAESIYETSQDFYEQSLQRDWERNARHWNNDFSSDSKFKSEAYRSRSRLFRPLTRTTERNSSASAAAALFQNMDIISTEPVNKKLPQASAGAALIKQLLQYRLRHDVKWYLTCMGAWQDAFNYGPCISYVHWEYEERPKNPPSNDAVRLDEQFEDQEILDLSDMDLSSLEFEDEQEDDGSGGRYVEGERDDLESLDTRQDEDPELIETFGGMADQFAGEEAEQDIETEIVKDNLRIDLVAPEYFRADPASDWRDVVNSSPYLIRICPMFVTDVENKMDIGEWNEMTRAQILSTGDKNLEYDATRRAREGDDRADSIDDTTRTEDTDFEVVFAHENIVRLQGRDWVYWTLGTQALLTEPQPIEDVYWHGKRPYVYGFSVIEAHKYAPHGQNELIRPLQENVNDLTNQRVDNIKLTLNKRHIIKRGSQVDLAALARNVPGGSVLADDPERDVKVMDTPDITGSVFNEVDRLTVEANELAGSFSGSSVQSNRSLNETVGGMQLLSEGANQLQEFDIRTFVETFVRPTLELSVLAIQAYENDEQIISIAGEEALEDFPDIDFEQLDIQSIWTMPMKLEVNVGLGATSPFQRVQNLQMGLNAVQPFVDPTQFNGAEIVKETMGAIGFADGSRFVKTKEQLQQEQGDQPQIPPEVQAEQAKVQAQMQLKQMELEFKAQIEQMKIQSQSELEAAKMAMTRELELIRIAAEQDKTLQQLKANVGIAQLNDKTRRDTVAVQEGTKNREMQLKREVGEGI